MTNAHKLICPTVHFMLFPTLTHTQVCLVPVCHGKWESGELMRRLIVGARCVSQTAHRSQCYAGSFHSFLGPGFQSLLSQCKRIDVTSFDLMILHGKKKKPYQEQFEQGHYLGSVLQPQIVILQIFVEVKMVMRVFYAWCLKSAVAPGMYGLIQ